jgi:diguanylate cyclase (GGDEF)-like protein
MTSTPDAPADGAVAQVSLPDRAGIQPKIHPRNRATPPIRGIAQKLTSSPRRTIAAFGAFFVVLIVGLFMVDLRGRHDVAIEGAKRSAANYAELLAEHTARAFEAVDRSLRGAELIRLNLAARSKDNDEGESARREAANEALRHLQQTSPLLVSIGWTNAAGDIEAHSNTGPLPRPNLAETPHFIAQRDSNADELYIAQPYRSPVDGRWLAAVSRRLSNPDGSFAGIAGAVLDQSYFAGIYRSIRFGTNGAALVLNRNGNVLAREPLLDDVYENNYAGGALLKEYLPKSPGGAFETICIIDGVDCIVGYQAVAGLPLIVVVSYDRADVLAPWYRHLYTFGPLTALVVLVFMAGTILLMWQTRNLAKKTGILEVTLENMAHGLAMFDAAQRLTVCNRRYAEMYGLTSEQVRPGASLRSILESRIAVNSGPLTAREYIDKRIEELPCNQPFHAVNQLCDGRVISVSSQPISAGGWVAIHQDITDRRHDDDKVAFMARHDLLTGIANRTYFMERLEEAAARLRRRHMPFTVIMLDLDRFKNVNDSLGHPAGDALLKETTYRLKSTLREIDFLARFGGDEFAIILEAGENQREAATAVANRILDILTAPYNINGNMVSIGTSIGIASAPADGSDPDALMKKADLALYRTKSEGRNGYRFFDERMTVEAEARRLMEAELRGALARNELEVHYQPIIDVKTQKVFGVEALARWRHPTKGYIEPAEFIPLAEETGLIHTLGEFVLQKACTDAMGWPSHIKVAVNISPMQFRKCSLLDIILCVLVETGLAPERLELEITETTLLEEETPHFAVMHRLKNLGISISLDDFGTGYSSLSYLTMFPFDKIKIDRSFTKNLTHRSDCAAIVSAVLALGAGLELATVAEGVETEPQFEMLRAAGVQFAQGYLFGRPCCASELDFDRDRTDQKLGNVA